MIPYTDMIKLKNKDTNFSNANLNKIQSFSVKRTLSREKTMEHGRVSANCKEKYIQQPKKLCNFI